MQAFARHSSQARIVTTTAVFDSDTSYEAPIKKGPPKVVGIVDSLSMDLSAIKVGLEGPTMEENASLSRMYVGRLLVWLGVAHSPDFIVVKEN